MSAPVIKFEDGAAYDRMMGVWTQFVGAQFLNGFNRPLASAGLMLDVAPRLHAADHRHSRLLLSMASTRHRNRLNCQQPRRCRGGSFQDRRCHGVARRHAFDMAVMALVIFFVPQPEISVAEMKRVIRPGGTVGTYVWDVFGGGMPPEPIFRVLRSLAIEHPLPPRSDASRAEDLLNLWRNAG